MNLLTINNKLLRYKNKLVMRGSSSPVLSTVENISVNNNILTFDPVKNATNYEVFVDGVNIGTYQVSAGETWVLDEIVDGLSIETTQVDFVSNNTQFSYINSRKGYIAYSNSEEFDEANMVYDTAQWTNEAYRTVTFDSPVTDTALLTWLQANGVKQ